MLAVIITALVDWVYNTKLLTYFLIHDSFVHLFIIYLFV